MCIPIQLGIDEQEWFEKWKKEKEDKEVVNSIELWDADDIAKELMRPENNIIYSTFFKDNINKPIIAPKVRDLGWDFSGKWCICNYSNISAFNTRVIAYHIFDGNKFGKSEELYLGHLKPNEDIDNINFRDDIKSFTLGYYIYTTVNIENNKEGIIVYIEYNDCYGNVYNTKTEIIITEVFNEGKTSFSIETFIN